MRGTEIDLHQLTVDEALPRLEKFLYDAYRAGLIQVWIVHGKGTGTLRREVTRYLTGHPLVRSYCSADRWHGGIGATEVQLSSK
jgi:DNA mismatch repair protein MutS2